MDERTRKAADLIAERVAAIRPLLAGLPSSVQGAILAELTGTWLGGHIVLGNAKGTRAAWEMLLTVQCDAVRAIAELEYQERGGDGFGVGTG